MEIGAGVHVQRATRRLPRSHVLVALLTSASGVTYAWVRAASARAFAGSLSFAGYCERVRPPEAYPCHMDQAGQVRGYLFAVLLMWAGFAGLSLLLAVNGRGWLSLAPIAGVGIAALAQAVLGLHAGVLAIAVPWLGVNAESVIGPPTAGAGFWAVHSLLAVALDLTLMALPAVAVVVFVRPARMRVRWRDRRSLDLAILGCLAVAAALVLFGGGHRPWRSLGFVTGVPIMLPGIAMFAFGLLLPRRSAWWPWAVGPVAVLLSQGPTGILALTVMGYGTTIWFNGVLWLATIGLAGASVFPLAARLERRKRAKNQDDLTPAAATPSGRWWVVEDRVREAEEEGTDEPATEVGTRARRRLRAPLVGIAIGLVVVSGIAAGADPLPIRFSVALPTYLGLRTRAQDIRAQENLAIALTAVERFRATNDLGDFTPEEGAALAPSIAWRDHPVGTGSRLAVGIVDVSSSGVRLATVSVSGAAFCVESARASGWAPTLGVGAAHGTMGGADALKRAISRCASQPFAPASLPDLETVVGTMCDGQANDLIITCRAVQRLVRDTLADPHPVSG